MKKSGHLLVTMSVANSMNLKYKSWLLLGSILPDILVHTYLMGHTWDKAYKRVTKSIQSLEKHGRMNRLSCLKLGYILHYVEDFFTYPHNSIFEGDILEHCRYENRLDNYMKTVKGLHITDTEEKIGGVFGSIKYQIEKKHQSYIEGSHSIENDTKFIFSMTYSVIKYFALKFTENQIIARGEKLKLNEKYLAQGLFNK